MIHLLTHVILEKLRNYVYVNQKLIIYLKVDNVIKTMVIKIINIHVKMLKFIKIVGVMVYVKKVVFVIEIRQLKS